LQIATATSTAISASPKIVLTPTKQMETAASDRPMAMAVDRDRAAAGAVDAALVIAMIVATGLSG